MKKTLTKRAISIFLAVLMAVTGLIPTLSAFAGDGVEGYYELQIFYDDTDTIVPKYQEDGTTEYVETMYEGDTLQLTYQLIDSTFPDSGYVKWYSEAPTLADVDQTGKVKAFDSSKGAIVKVWINNEVKTIPVVGSVIAKVIEKALFNDYVDLDSMDTEAICDLVTTTLGSDSSISDYIESYQGDLVDSLRTYLDTMTPDIYCELYDKDGTKVAEDEIHVVVKKCEEWYADFLPNGTHITNKSQIATTQAKGNTVQLTAITTPQRLNFGTIYTVKSSSIFSQGKVVATVTDAGLVTFKNTGTVTIMASPDSEDVINGLLKFVNYFYKLENTGTLNTDKAAEILIKYIGIDINRQVLAGILDACFAVYKIAGDSADPVQLSATAVELIANLCLQFAYNDTIDFTVVEAQPIKDFEISGVTSAKEGVQTQLTIDDMDPSTGDKSDIVWRSSDPSIASVDSSGVVTALDAGGSLGSLSSQTCTIYATSTTNNIERSVTFTVTGKTGKYISYAEINGDSSVGIDETEDFSYSIYPQRVNESGNLYTSWGMVTGTDDDGNTTYSWATEDTPATDANGVAQIDSNGHFTPLAGGTCTIAFQAKTGYLLSDGSFYEISSKTVTKEIETGIPVESISIGVTEALGNGGELGRNQTVNINGTDYYYCTEKIGVGNMYYGKGATVKATVYPSDATNQNLTWVVDNTNFDTEVSSSTQSIDVTQKAGHESTQTFNIYAVSADGAVKSNTITVCVTRNYASANTIDQESIEMTNGKTTEATHTMTFEGTWESGAYACYDANWYSSDEEIFTVTNKGNDNSDAILEAHDVGTATLYCVSADGAFLDSVEVTVKPDKQTLEELVNICDNTIVLMTKHNKDYYKAYMRSLDKAYTILYENDMASQNAVDTAAEDLLASFMKIGGFVGISDLEMTATNNESLDSDYVTVKVGTAKNYKNYSYDFDFNVSPKGAMYSKEVWTSSNSSISVDENGVCTPTSNDACAADITCTITDYSGNQVTDTKHIAFAKTKAEGVELDSYTIDGALIGEQQTLKATVTPKNIFGNSTASVTSVKWSSSNENVATVDSEGVVTFVYGGTAVITCTTDDGGYTAQCFVTVTTNYDNLELLCKQLDDLSLNEVSYYPETWQPYIEAKTKAETMISTKGYSQEAVDAQYETLNNAYNNLKKYVEIQKVELYLDGEPTSEFYQYDLKLLKEGISYKNAKLDLNVRLYPNNATYTSATWTSSTTDISVSTDGVCSPTVNSSCYGKITCTVVDSFGQEFTDDVFVSYSYNPVTAVTLSQDSITGTIGSTEQLTATIEPTGSSLMHIAKADITDYYWESDDESVATVDNTGLVTFVGAGSTIVRCVSYDGGVNGECKVSTEGDRTALKAAIDQYADTDYRDYEYSYGTAFKKAYEEAEAVLSDKSKTQDEIDEATSNLEVAGNALAEHPYIDVTSIKVTYATQKRSLTESVTAVSSGTVGDNDALSINLSSGNYANYNDYDDVILTASNLPSNSMYESVTWEVVENNEMDIVSNKLAVLTIHPNKSAREGNASALVRATYTDHYGQTISRDIWVTMSDTVCTGLTLEESNLNILGSSDPVQLHWTTTGASGYDDTVIFSSSDTDVATVDENGLVTVVDAGSCVITAKTRDGGYTQSVNVTITTDYSKLIAKVTECETLIKETKDTDQYTQETIDTLSEKTDAGRKIIDAGEASQKEVNEALKALNEAYDNLKGYIPATGITLSLNDDQEAVSEVNPGFIRNEGASLNSAYVQLAYKVTPDEGKYDAIEWTSSNSNITVDDTGKVTNNSALGGAALITVKITTVYGETYSDSVYVSFVRYGVTKVGFDTDLLYGSPKETKAIPLALETSSKLSQITPTVEDCIYKSNDESIATVDENGNVMFVSQGKTTITVTSMDGGITGELTVQTTWDTSALQEALAQANALTYTDYEYDYGTELKSATEAAQTVYDNPDATQDEIDSACTRLQTAITNLDGHKFVTPVVTMTVNDSAIEDGMTYEVTNNAVKVNVAVAGDMYKSVTLSTENESGVTTTIGDRDFTIKKNEVGTDGSLTVKAVVVDNYDRETTYSYTIYVTDLIVDIDSISITLDGEAVTSINKTGYKTLFTDFEPIQLGYVVNTPSATKPTKVEWSSSNSSYITVDENGLVNITTAAKPNKSVTTNVTCTVTNPDGTTVSTKIPVTLTRSSVLGN